MTPLVSQLWPQFMADPDFAACFGRVVVEHAQMLRQERQVIFTLRSSAPLDKGLCARLLASLAPDYEGFELRINNLFGYATLDEAGLRELMEEMKRDGIPINGFLSFNTRSSKARVNFLPRPFLATINLPCGIYYRLYFACGFQNKYVHQQNGHLTKACQALNFVHT